MLLEDSSHIGRRRISKRDPQNKKVDYSYIFHIYVPKDVLVFEHRRQLAKKGLVTFPDGDIPPPTALAGRRYIGEPQPVEKPRTLRGKSVFGSMLNRLDSDGPMTAKEGAEQTQNNRRSMVVSYNPVISNPYDVKIV